MENYFIPRDARIISELSPENRAGFKGTFRMLRILPQVILWLSARDLTIQRVLRLFQGCVHGRFAAIVRQDWVDDSQYFKK